MDGSKEPRIRSTCNACQEAKVRCSRDKPSCRRCRNQSRRCVYSYVQRLGRPRRNTGPSSTEKSPVDHDNMYDGFTELGHRSSAASPPVQQSGATDSHEHHSGASEPEPEAQYMDLLDLSFNNEYDGNDTIMQGYTGGNLQSDRPPSDQASSAHLEDFDSLFPMLDGHVASQSQSDFSILTSAIPSSVRPRVGTSSGTGPELDRISNDIRTPISESTPSASHGSGTATIASTSECDFLCSASTLNHRGAYTLDAFTSGFNSDLSSRPISASQTDGGASERACKCYQSVLRRLSDLHENYTSNINITFDQIMQLEKDVRTQVSAALECRRCSNKGSLLLLLSVLLHNTMELLEGMRLGDDGMTGMEEDGDMLQGRSSSVQVISIEITALRLGNYEIDGEEKAGFLKHLLNQRLQKLAATIKKLHNWMQKNTGRQGVAFNRKIGTMLMTEIYQRLLSIIHRLEN
ncbi:hypothetical protein BP5796_13028 [Coleophoma crateriformis]|uniref:Zn(2)-C6 fungal-type domain-containing protein n=1 Tax=Coleophoma crateriformis TaxID=565419 RepID=A0A3D8Q564_9HELO|nr:hypothetical protein BP5796_13028 [Coleophoma crateriformis]